MSARWLIVVSILAISSASTIDHAKKKHHHHHHKHDKHDSNTPAVATAPDASPKSLISKAADKPEAKKEGSEEQIMKKMKTLETELAKKEEAVQGVVTKGRVEVNGPLPADFAERFVQGVAKATGCDPSEVKVIETNPVSLLQTKSDIVEVVFEAPADVVKAVEDQAADPDSKLATGSLKEFLVAKDSAAAEDTPVQEKGIDVDTEMPYGELEPFGREDTAQELTESSIKESDEMVDQLERAEVAEEKRAVFRALTRLLGAAITSFDGIARSQTGNIDEYNKSPL
eukprot:gnl/MRDRNA2_/MRDRNA2_91658_c0_seq1.p1 gnl/MRDRNA2_/MRDRNA2_91658_c0~~gnl/MRDRNA2_/MRDRNA2_91658_c0_seq1.p1  ORF type:complete len:285 (+),score=86.05 gnl/MRDRNA2_/MRDRNA2_91658_c0_seq1:177-1031(+)